MISDLFTLLRLKKRRTTERQRLHGLRLMRAKQSAILHHAPSATLRMQIIARKDELDLEIAEAASRLERIELDIQKFRKVVSKRLPT